ncbi:MAG TPA: B12-binding domain-containing radical SAM protein [Clostridiales bacterium]|nr:B12-binding domain-containing radical SAM protein [Clostridiales bacterium]
MKVLLVTLDSKFIHANLAVRYLKKFCKDDDFDIEIKEFTINQKQEYILGEIFSANAELICFSSYVWNIEYIKEIAYIIKEAKNNVRILCGGPEVSFEVEKFMNDQSFIDYVIFGEGELTFREFLLEYQKSCPNLKTIKGLAYRENDKVAINENRELITNLDMINYPYEEDDNFQDKIIYYESSRGCPFCCSFCMSSIDKRMRTFSLDRVKKDLSLLLNTGARQIKFVDRTFNADYKRSMEIMDFIVKHNKNNMTIHFEITADIINDEFLNYVKKLPVNMFQFEIGVQSLNGETLAEINRRMNIQRLNEVVECIESGRNIHIHLDLIAGLPYEGYESFKTSFDGIHKLHAEKIQLGFLKVLKGTKIYEDIKKHEIRYRNVSPYEVICTKYISAEEILKLKNIEEQVDKYYNEKYFESSLGYILKNLFPESEFEFYEDFSVYWQQNNLYKMSHSRKKLYKILFDYVKYNDKLTDEFVYCLRYDYVFNNQQEELPNYLCRDAEDRYKSIKRLLANNSKFKEMYFNEAEKDDKIVNEFRIVTIGTDDVLFIYKEKDNIFNRCRTYIINDFLEEMAYEQKG